MNKFLIKFIPLICTAGFFIITQNCWAQQSKREIKKFEKAYSLYQNENYHFAHLLLKEVLAKEPDYSDALLLLADTYNQLDSTEAEISTLESALELSDKKLIVYRIAEAAYSIGWYEKALLNFQKSQIDYSSNTKRSNEILHKINNCEFAIQAVNQPVEFNPQRLSSNVNSDFDEYWPSISVDKSKLVITRLQKVAGRFPQEDFYLSERDSSGWKKAVPITEINTNQNEGAQTLSADGKILFFTACSKYDGKGSCDIYYSKFENNSWTPAKNAGAPVNTKYWDSQPGFSSDYRFIYLSSNRPGGFGEKDIWRIPLIGFNADGTFRWGEPENLGDSINTPGNEISPFIHANNRQLFFASDFWPGMGGFDLFHSEINENNRFCKAKNLGFPINTFENEQGLCISADGLESYFSSGRNKKTGLDIYQFEMDESIRPLPVTYVKAKVIDKETQFPIQASVELIDLNHLNQERRKQTADKNGEFLVCLPVGINYGFNVSENGYLFYSQSFPLLEIKTIHEPYFAPIELEKIKVGAEMNLYNIYFETGAFTLLPESEPELNKLLGFLSTNINLEVQIQGHTDDVGNETDNQLLSEKRAQSVFTYLIENGVDNNRLQFVGLGEKHPVASNETKEGRQLNRRTTLKIIGI